MKFYNIPDHIKSLEFDGDKTDRRLHHIDSFIWGYLDQESYEETEKLIDKFCIKNHNYEIYFLYDVSGYDYWINGMEEHNYIMITVMFNDTNFEKGHLKDLENDLEKAYDYADQLQNHEPELY